MVKGKWCSLCDRVMTARQLRRHIAECRKQARIKDGKW